MSRIIQGNSLDVLKTLPDESVHCCVTSVPYWGLRDYKLEPQIWDGDPGCSHEFGYGVRSPWANSVPGPSNRGKNGEDYVNREKISGNFCQKCGAWKGSYGLEPTIELYVKHSVDIFGEVRRVLRKDGTLWLNIGDCYATGAGLKPKDLCMMPARVALALQADGWWLRQDIIWNKPNPMPESVRDRCTKSHEYIFLFSKSERYYFDNKAILEESIRANEARYDNGKNGHGGGISHAGQGSSTRKFRSDSTPEDLARAFNRRRDANVEPRQDKMKIPSNWDLGPGHHIAYHREGRSGNMERKPGLARGCPEGTGSNVCGSVPWEGVKRNRRSVWTVATQPFPEAHFATFPEKLIEPCIKAGTSEKGCCPECGAPWVRNTKKNFVPQPDVTKERVDYRRETEGVPGQAWKGAPRGTTEIETLGWKPTCEHGRDPVPCVVLDNFGGAGTTGVVARKLNRNYIIIELNPAYIEMAERRIEKEIGLLFEAVN